MKMFIKNVLSGLGLLALATATGCSEWAGNELYGMEVEALTLEVGCPVNTCDVTVSSDKTFREFELLANGGSDSTGDGRYFVCIEAGVKVQNGRKDKRIQLNKFMNIVGCKGAEGVRKALIVNNREEFVTDESGYVDPVTNHDLQSAIYSETNEQDILGDYRAFKIENVDIETKGLFGVPLTLQHTIDRSGRHAYFESFKSELRACHGCYKHRLYGYDADIR